MQKAVHPMISIAKAYLKGEPPMFKIVRFPEKLNSFFAGLEAEFHWDHFEYFRLLVLLMAFSWGKRNITNLYRHLDGENHSHRTRFNNFLLVGRNDMGELLADKAYSMLLELGLKSGDVVYMIIDDSKKEKQGEKMDGVSWIHDPTTGRKIKGHQYVTAILHFKGFEISFGIKLYASKAFANKLGVDFRKSTELAAELINGFEPPVHGVKTVVLFDSYYLCKTVITACNQKKFFFASTLKSNRNLFRRGHKTKANKLGKKLFKTRRKRHFKITRESGAVSYDYVDAGWLDVSKAGRLHVVFSRKEGEGKILGIVTNDPNMSAKEIIAAYDKRWNIEVFFKDSKQYLGLGQYQNVPYGAAVTHLHLVCFAHALLTHIAIRRYCEKGKKAKQAVNLSIGNLQNELRRIVWDDLTLYLRKFSTGDAVIKELGKILVAA